MPSSQNSGATNSSKFLNDIQSRLSKSIQTVSDDVVEINSGSNSSGASVVYSKDIDLGTHDVLNVGSATVGTLNYTTLNPVPSIGSLTVAEITQLENINTTTISTTQWGYLGLQNQSVGTADNVQHSTLNLIVSGGTPYITLDNGSSSHITSFDGTNTTYGIIDSGGGNEYRFILAGAQPLTIAAQSVTLGSACLLTAPLNTIASNTSTGTAGTITWDANYVYVCTATNIWKRVVLDATPW